MTDEMLYKEALRYFEHLKLIRQETLPYTEAEKDADMFNIVIRLLKDKVKSTEDESQPTDKDFFDWLDEHAHIADGLNAIDRERYDET